MDTAATQLHYNPLWLTLTMRGLEPPPTPPAPAGLPSPVAHFLSGLRAQPRCPGAVQEGVECQCWPATILAEVARLCCSDFIGGKPTHNFQMSQNHPLNRVYLVWTSLLVSPQGGTVSPHNVLAWGVLAQLGRSSLCPELVPKPCHNLPDLQLHFFRECL